MKKGWKNFYIIALKFWDQFNANSVLFCLSGYKSIKMRHLYMKHVEKNNKQCIEGLASLIFSKAFSILRNTLPWHSKEIVHLLFCAFQTKLNKAVNIFVDYQNGSEMYNWYQVSVEDLDENVDENLAWLTQKTEDLKINKDNLTHPRTVNYLTLPCFCRINL